MNDLINKLFPESITIELNKLLQEFAEADFSVADIKNRIDEFNESIRTYLYLLSLNSGNSEIAYRIYKANNLIKLDHISAFEDAFRKGKAKEYLSKLSKTDKMALLVDLKINVKDDEKYKLSVQDRDYLNLINDSIIQDQEKHKTNLVDKFINHKKD